MLLEIWTAFPEVWCGHVWQMQPDQEKVQKIQIFRGTEVFSNGYIFILATSDISSDTDFAWLIEGKQDFQGEERDGLSEGNLLCFV